MLGVASIVEWPTASKLFKRYETDKEYQDLNDFKKSHGQTSIVPVVCCRVPESDDDKPKFYLIDGYNRIEAAKRAGEKFIRADEYTYSDEKEMEAHAIALNAKRRHLDAVTASRLALRLVELYKPSKEETKAKQSSNAKNRHTVKNLASGTPVVQARTKAKSTLKKASKEVGVSPETVRKVKAIDKSGNKEVITAVESGKMSVKEGFKKVAAPKKKVPVAHQDKDSNNDKVLWDSVNKICDAVNILSYVHGRFSDDSRDRAFKMLVPKVEQLHIIINRLSAKSAKAS
jgi:hypothetical protein